MGKRRSSTRIGSLYNSRIGRIIRLLLPLVIVWSIVDALHTHRNFTKPDPADDPPLLGKEKIYIASIHWNTENILRTHWTKAVFDVVQELGHDNVFVSIQESGGWDGTKSVLSAFGSALEAAGIRNRILLDATTHADEVNRSPAETGWIRTPRGQVERRRIPYLASLRNLVMEPLYEMQANGEIFDKILFLNDVAFSISDVRRLLSTRDGEYAAVCSLDFKDPPKFYDTFALRDSEGHDFLMQTWPFLRSRRSREAMKRNAPVPVSSCWNGIVAMDAEPFYSNDLSFRGLPDSLSVKHLEASECCLIHADNPLSRTKGVWLNPRVRVGYDGQAYDAVSSQTSWLSLLEIWGSCWQNRFLRWSTTTWFKNRIVRWRLYWWRREDPSHQEVEEMCIVNEMHVLVHDGWIHV